MIILIIIITFILYIFIPKYKLWECKIVCTYLWSLYAYTCLWNFSLTILILIKIIYRFNFLFGINWWKNIFSRFKIFCVWAILDFFYFIIHYCIYLYIIKCLINIIIKNLLNIWKYAHWIIIRNDRFIRTIDKIRFIIIFVLNFIF